MACCLIGLGANLGNRAATLDRAVAQLGADTQMRVVESSRWLETSPIGGPPGQPPYLNGTAVVETSLSPPSVLAELRRIETELGRRRRRRWGPRTIDLDLLLYDRLVMQTPSLVLPHPRMAWRRFVLEPAASVAPAMVHPSTGWTVAQLLDHLNTTEPYVAITGGIGAGKTLLARLLARRCGSRLIVEKLNLKQLEAFYADPAGHAWDTELEFLQQRARLLAADAPGWSRQNQLAVSDFWFDQSLAFARAWLGGEQLAAFAERWEQTRRGVVRPRLIVLLDVPAEELRRRVLRRGRRCERGLTGQQIEQTRRAVVEQASLPDQGPILRFAGEGQKEILNEALAAVNAMQ